MRRTTLNNILRFGLGIVIDSLIMLAINKIVDITFNKIIKPAFNKK